MANANQPNGFVPARTVNGADQNLQIMKFATASTDGVAIGIGDLVKLSGGCDSLGIPIVAQAAEGNALVGAVVGVEVDGAALDTVYRKASTTRYVFVNVDPNTIYVAQADAAIALADGTKNFHLVAGTPNTATGQSTMKVKTSDLNTTSTFELAGMGFPYDLQNTPAAAYNKILVKINAHQFATVRTGV